MNILNKKLEMITILAGVTLISLFGCSVKQDDPAKLVTITLWNYYNGQTKMAFDNLVAEFNDTVGMDEGIIVDSVSQGDVDQLAEEVYNAANHKIGADAMPHIFAAYPDNVFRVDELGMTANLNKYFTDEELDQFQDNFLLDCYLGEDAGLKLIPIARSSENLYLNKTDWDEFALETGAGLSDLSTWEGVRKISQTYYEWTDQKTETPNDGKAFIGFDSIANYVIIAGEQCGLGLYQTDGNNIEFMFDQELAKKIWDNLYVPYLNGYYANYGKFRSDDAKIGQILAYTGSSAGAQYFPLEVTLDVSDTYKIDSLVLPYPYFEDGKRIAMAQGAGFAIAKSDEDHEYASSVFLKWFTDKEQNVKFSIASGYLPVKKDAFKLDLEQEASKYNEQYRENSAVQLSVKTTQDMLDSYELYSNRPFKGTYDIRQFLNTAILDSIANDLSKIEEKMKSGVSKKEAVSSLSDQEHFEIWYQGILDQTAFILNAE